MGLKKGSSSHTDLWPTIQSVRQLANPNSSHSSPLTNEAEILQSLLAGTMELEGLMPWSSNYTFLVTLTCPTDETTLLAVYKPCSGERPLWDFPDGSLCQREFATYLISHVLGWPNIPPTVLAKGPHGRGSLQLFVEADYEAHYFNIRGISNFTESFRQIAVFDYIVNNADRKGGHCLTDKNGRLWAIDHGLTFHTDFKLRTVIWDFCEEIIPDPLLQDLIYLQQQLLEPSELCRLLNKFISPAEIRAFQKRIDTLVSSGRFPRLQAGRNMPYPPI